jgi:SEC-C motif-containing protein
MQTKEDCPCGSEKSYQQCCAIFHKGVSNPNTPEELMRSRYSAFALNKFEYIKNTMSGKAAQGFIADPEEQTQSSSQWLGLDVIKSYNDKKNSNRAFVEFRALYTFEGATSILHELSEFTKINGRWFYTSGETKKSSRNDPCPCHSGKKLKRCHGSGGQDS